MTAPRLVVLRPSCFGVAPRTRETPAATEVREFPEVKAWLVSGRIARHMFRYSEAVLATHRVAHVSKPFPTALLLRALAHGRCAFVDDAGERVELGLVTLLRYFLLFVRDLVRLPWLLVSTRRDVARLAWQTADWRPRAADLSRPPLYLRSDLRFGLAAGGSVGHIAGVLNNLDRFGAKPIFVTSDRIPTVRDDIETHVVVPGPDFCGFEEMPQIYFNRQLTREALATLAGRKPSFVYQRYGLYSLSGLELALRLGAPFVVEYNGSEVWISRNWGRALRHERLASRIEALLLSAAQLVVVVSRPLRDQLLERGVAPERILVNSNGVDPERYAPSVDGSAVRRRHGLGAERVIGFIGTFGRWHGAEVLADAFGRLLSRRPGLRATVRLLLIGDGLTRPEAEARLERHGVRELAVFTGEVPQEQGPAHLGACDILASPHVRNPDGTPFFGSPTKVFEYMAMGRGIVASDLDQVGEVLKQDETALLVEPGDAEALAGGLERLLDDEALARRLGETARREVLAHHTWRSHTQRIVEALGWSAARASA